MAFSSSSVLNTLPILNGSNYTQWAVEMQSYLMTQGLWMILSGIETMPAELSAAAEGTKGGPTAKEVQERYKEHLEFFRRAQQIVGAISLKVDKLLKNAIVKETDPSKIWNALKNKYGKTTAPAIFANFRALSSIRVPPNAHPALALGQIQDL